jgi:TolB protein
MLICMIGVNLILAISQVEGGDSSSPPAVARLTTDGLEKARPAFAADGKALLVARHAPDGGAIGLWWVDPDGLAPDRRLTDRKLPEYHAAIEPSGRRVLFVAISQSGTQGNLDLASVNMDGSDLTSVVGDVGGKLSHQDWPSWSPDGSRFTFSSTHEGNQEIYTARADGSEVVRVTQSPGQDVHPCWAPRGDFVVFATDRWGGLELARAKVDGTGVERLTTSPGFDDYPAVSPDGERVAFVSNRDGDYEVYVAAIDGSDAVNLTRNPGRDTHPCWSPDGRSVVVVSDRDGGADLYRIDVRSGPD